jgi:hypothetical protein
MLSRLSLLFYYTLAASRRGKGSIQGHAAQGNDDVCFLFFVLIRVYSDLDFYP